MPTNFRLFKFTVNFLLESCKMQGFPICLGFASYLSWVKFLIVKLRISFKLCFKTNIFYRTYIWFCTLNEYFSAQGIIQELDLTIHADRGCGGYDVYIELIQEETTCNTSIISDFDRGVKLSWTGSQLGFCVDRPFFYDNSDEINFKIRSTSGDDFCPNSLTITMKDTKKYENRGMNDMVDIHMGSELRTAKRKLD